MYIFIPFAIKYTSLFICKCLFLKLRNKSSFFNKENRV